MSEGRRVRMMGCAPGAMKAPPPSPGQEVWGINNPWAQRRRRPTILREWTHWFNLHTMRHQRSAYLRGVNYLERKDGKRPVYMLEAYENIPGVVKFPGMDMVKHFGHRYFTSTGAWLVAYAVYVGVAELEIWGFEMHPTGEHAGQRAGFLYWVQEARKQGINVIVPKGAIGHPDGDGTGDKLIGDPREYRSYLYGYEPHTNYYRESF